MKIKPTYNGIEFDSNEEIEFYMWIQEAVLNDLIYEHYYQPEEYILSTKKIRLVEKKLKTKTKKVEKHLLHPHKYTPDFSVYLTATGLDLIPFICAEGIENAIIDIKGSFNQHGGDREFSINQKWVYEKYGVFVNKVVPEKLFKATWVPELARYTPKTKKLRAKYTKCKTIKEFLNKQ